MIVLAVDIGNTNICLSSYDGRWSDLTRIKTHSETWYDDFEDIISGKCFDQAVLSSVVPDYTESIKSLLEKKIGEKIIVISKAIETGLNITSFPDELGADLLCNAIAAHRKYPDEYVTVADFGTAFTTITVDPEGSMKGVTICPGLLTSLKALFENTSQIPHIRLDVPETVLGTDTVSSVRAGVIYGFVGQLQFIVGKIEQELGVHVKLIVTGGFSVYIAPYLNREKDIDINHTLEGAKIAFDLNYSGKAKID